MAEWGCLGGSVIRTLNFSQCHDLSSSPVLGSALTAPPFSAPPPLSVSVCVSLLNINIHLKKRLVSKRPSPNYTRSVPVSLGEGAAPCHTAKQPALRDRSVPACA